MDYVQKQGINIPKLGFGTWQLTGENCLHGVKFALKTGYKHIDTAQIYENEAEIGQALAESDINRHDIFLTTKVWRDFVAADRLENSVNESLRKLKTDYVDLLLIHWPVDEVPLEETMRALKAVQAAGKTRLIGVSNFTVAQMKTCIEEFGADLATNQVEYHPYLSQDPVLNFARKHDMFLTAYSPLGRMKLQNDTLQRIAQKYGKSETQVILRWHVQQPDVVAIPKSATPAHIASNLDIFDFELDYADMQAITDLNHNNQRLINPSFAPAWDVAA